MTWISGFANDPADPDPRLWFVVDANDHALVKFDHSRFDFLNGTPVKYIDGDGDGWADVVEADDAMVRYVARADLDPNASAETILALHNIIATSLFDARRATGQDRDKALRGLRARIDRFEGAAE